MASSPDLFVVCKNCGAEVSPYITECPYCGTRLRKRAPRIERDGTVSEPTPQRRRQAPRLPKLRPREIPGLATDEGRRPYATLLLVVLSLFGYLLLFVVDRVSVAVAGPIDGEWWRVATSPFLYANAWYELACVLAIGVFGWRLELRHGAPLVLALFALGGMGGAALEAVVAPVPLALGGNGAALAMLAAWAIPDLLARRRGEEDDSDMLGALVIGLVVLAMPAAVLEASPIAGLAGLAAGALCGLALGFARAGRR